MKNVDSTNSFELDGRNLIILSALPKEKADQCSEDKKSKNDFEDKRNFQLLFYGLNTYGKFKNQVN